MAILHQATLTPTKLELITSYLDQLGWGGGPVDLVGGYRYDDPDGKVGVEGLIAVRGDDAFHIPVTYREAPLAEAEAYLIATVEHSVLGQRWVYDAAHDPVAIACFTRALAGDQAQAVLNVFDAAEQLVEVREPAVVITVRNPAEAEAVTFVRRIEEDATGDPTSPALVAEWAGDNSAVVAFG